MPRKKKRKKYKLKAHKATAKRFKSSGSGKIMRTKGDQGHFDAENQKGQNEKLAKCLK